MPSVILAMMDWLFHTKDEVNGDVQVDGSKHCYVFARHCSNILSDSVWFSCLVFYFIWSLINGFRFLVEFWEGLQELVI